MNDTDRQILLAHASSTRARAAIELHLVRLAIDALRAADYELLFDDGDDTIRTSDNDEAVSHLFGVDEATIHTRNTSTGKTSFVFLVFGNDGHDVICDYGVTLDDALKPVNDEADKISNGEKTIGFTL